MSSGILRVLAATAVAALAACSGDGGGASAPSGDALVQSLVTDNTTDSAEPVEINDLALDFSDDEAAFSAFFE